MAGYIGRIPVPQAVLHAEAYIATAGQTAFSTSNGYVPGYIMVYKNGVLLPASDYTATNGSVVELDAGVACNAGDTVDIWIFGTFEAAFFTSLASDIDANSYNITNIGRIEFSDGTNLAPSITNTGDADTGFYFPTADKIGSTTGGNVALSIFNNGTAGIYEFGGTTGYLRHTGSSTLYLDASSTGTGGNIIVRSGSSYTERLRIDTQGDLLLGTTTSRARLTVYDTDATVASIWSNQTGALIQYVDVGGGINVKAGGQGNDFIIQTGGATRATVSNAGEFGIGGTPISGYKLTVADSSDVKAILSSTSGNTELYFDNSGANLQWIKSDRTASDLRFGIANTERMRIDSSGHLLIGGTSGTYPLEVTHPNGNGIAYKCSTNSVTNFVGALNSVGLLGTLTVHPVALWTGNSERLRIDVDGRLSLNSTSTTSRAHFQVDTGYSTGNATDTKNVTIGQGTAALGFAFDTTDGGLMQSINPGISWYPLTLSASSHRFIITGTEAGRFDSNRNLLVGTTTFGGAAGKGIHVKDATRGNVIVETGSSKTEMFVDRGDFYIDHYPNGNIIFRTDTRTERLRINNNGVSFDGGANYLDDYEEGDWSPTVTGMSISSARARYFKVGNKVTICATISVISSTGTSNVRVSNLPFTPNILNGDAEWHGACMFSSVNFVNTYQTLCAYLYTGGTYVEFYGTRDNGTWDAVNNNELGVSDAFQFTITYNV